MHFLKKNIKKDAAIDCYRVTINLGNKHLNNEFEINYKNIQKVSVNELCDVSRTCHRINV